MRQARSTYQYTHLVVGHRGASGRLPENTLAAFRAAAEDGAGGVEFDVRMSADGVPVVIHDATLYRTTGVRGRVTDLLAAELAEVRAVARPRAGAAVSPVPTGSAKLLGVPSLDEAIEVCLAEGLRMFVELKGGAGVEEAVAERLDRHGCHDRAVVLSFNHAALRRIRRVDERVETAASVRPTLSAPRPSPERVVEWVERAGAKSAALHVTLATARRVDALRERGYGAHVWTVNSAAIARRLATVGVDSIMTDYPALLADEARR